MTKKLFSFLLASILMACTCLSAFAADSQGGTVSNTIGNVYNGVSDVQTAVSDPLNWYVSNQLTGDSKYSDGIDLICPNGDYEEHYDDAFSSAVCPYDGEALIIKGNGVTFTPGGGSGHLGSGVGRKDLPGYTSGTSNVNRNGALMLSMEHNFIAATNNNFFYPSTDANYNYKSAFCSDYQGNYVSSASLGDDIEYLFSCSDNVYSSKMWSSSSSTTFYHAPAVSFKVTAPVDGYYSVYSSPTCSYGGYVPDASSSFERKNVTLEFYKNVTSSTKFSRIYYAKGQKIVITARPYIVYQLYGIGRPVTSSYFYCYGSPVLLVEPSDASSANLSSQTKIVINNNNVKNTWNGNVYVDASNHLTYIFPQYTYINENYEHVTSISENPIIYNSETNQYYTYSPTTNNYYYISFGEKSDPDSPTPTPTVKPSTPETAEGGDSNSGKILEVLRKILDEMKNGFANVRVWLANIQTEINTGFTDFTKKFTEYSINVKTWFTNLQSSISTSATNLANSINLAIENLNVNIQNTFNKKFPDLPEPTPDPALPAPVEPSTGDKWSDDIVSGTSISGTVNAKAGDYVLATVSARSALTIPDSMTYLYKGNVFASNDVNQSMSFAYQKIAEDGTYTYTFKQATAGRMYLSLIVLSDIDGLSYSGKYHIEVRSKTPVSVPEKSDGDMLVWGCSSTAWLTSDTSNSKSWITNPDDLTYIGGASNSGQSRQANFIDLGTGAVSRTFFPYEEIGENLFFVVDAVEIIPKTITPSPSPSPSPEPVDPILPDTQNYIIPKMNSNTFADGHGTWIASGSSKYSDVFDFFHAFDRSTSDFWETNVSPSYLKIEIPDPENYYIDGYIMRISKFNNRYAKDWTLQGSDDGNTWDDLDKQTGQNLSDMEEHKYTLTLRKAYKYYRVNMSNYASSMCSLSHFNLLGYDAKDVVTPTPSPSPTPGPGTDPTPAPTDKPSNGNTNNFWNFVFPGGNDDGTENGHKGILWALISLLIAVVTFVLGLGSAYSYVFPFLPAGLVTTIHICVLVLLLFAIIKFVRSFL